MQKRLDLGDIGKVNVGGVQDAVVRPPAHTLHLHFDRRVTEAVTKINSQSLVQRQLPDHVLTYRAEGSTG